MLKISVVGVTGLVGSVMLKVLEERGFTNIDFIPVASAKSVGKEVEFCGKKYKIISAEAAIAKKPDIAIFSAGADVSLQLAPIFAETGCFVIDNSSAWRMFQRIPLVVPEINADKINDKTKIIANPNCSTIQMVMALAPLHKIYEISRLVISTYQSVTGTGIKAVQQLENESKGLEAIKAYPYQIHRNLFPHGGVFMPNKYTSEEQKLNKETCKILSDYSLRITSTVVRVPVTGGHSMAINVEFKNQFKIDNIIKLLEEMTGVIVMDDVEHNIYPMPLFSEGKDDVFVGRIRRDKSNPNTLNIWVVADNLRKGAATNAVQIAQYLIDKKLVKA
jgi:aspartate-semialdehyde dehydrogenase